MYIPSCKCIFYVGDDQKSLKATSLKYGECRWAGGGDEIILSFLNIFFILNNFRFSKWL